MVKYSLKMQYNLQVRKKKRSLEWTITDSAFNINTALKS